MKALIFCFIIAISLSLDLIIINIIEKSYFTISSLILTSITIFLVGVEAVLWIFNFPDQIQTGIICINFIINISKSTFFSIAYFINNSISSSMVILSFLTFILSIIMGLLNINNSPHIEPVVSSNNIQNTNIKTTIFSLDEPLTCTICLEDFIKDEEVNITECNHFFHQGCAKDIVNNNIKKCPVCRAELFSIVVDREQLN